MFTGGWIVHEELSDNDIAIFNGATAISDNVKFEPIAVATQILNGTNYFFICKAAIEQTEYFAKVYIYRTILNSLEITEISPI